MTNRLLYLAGDDIAAIRGVKGRFEPNMEGEDTAGVQVRFSNSVIGEIFKSWAMAKPSGTHAFQISGETGEVRALLP